MRSWFRRRDRDEELGEEIRAHLEMAIRDRVERGEPRAQAEAAARREIGNVATIQEVTREMWGGMWLERLAQDLRYGLRLLRRNPGFTAVAVLSLALGIGANTAIFQVIDAIRLRTLPVPNPSELAEIRLVDPAGMRGSFHSWNPTLTHPIWEQIRARQQGFSSMLAAGTTGFNLASGGESRPAQGLWVSGGLFSALGVRPAAGRVLTDADDRRGCPARAVLSYPFWQREYGGDRSVVGRTITLQAQPVEIVGVAQAGFFRARGRPTVRRGGAHLRRANPRRWPQRPRLRHQLVADGHGTSQARMDRPAGDRAARDDLSRSLPLDAPVELPRD